MQKGQITIKKVVISKSIVVSGFFIFSLVSSQLLIQQSYAYRECTNAASGCAGKCGVGNFADVNTNGSGGYSCSCPGIACGGTQGQSCGSTSTSHCESSTIGFNNCGKGGVCGSLFCCDTAQKQSGWTQKYKCDPTTKACVRDDTGGNTTDPYCGGKCGVNPVTNNGSNTGTVTTQNNNTTASTNCANSGDGLFCNTDHSGFVHDSKSTSNWLMQCSGGNVSAYQKCYTGCTVDPNPNNPDKCNDSGNVSLGVPINNPQTTPTLFKCSCISENNTNTNLGMITCTDNNGGSPIVGKCAANYSCTQQGSIVISSTQNKVISDFSNTNSCSANKIQCDSTGNGFHVINGVYGNYCDETHIFCDASAYGYCGNNEICDQSLNNGNGGCRVGQQQQSSSSSSNSSNSTGTGISCIQADNVNFPDYYYYTGPDTFNSTTGSCGPNQYCHNAQPNQGVCTPAPNPCTWWDYNHNLCKNPTTGNLLILGASINKSTGPKPVDDTLSAKINAYTNTIGATFLAQTQSRTPNKVLAAKTYTATDIVTYTVTNNNVAKYNNPHFNMSSLPSGVYKLFLHVDRYLNKTVSDSAGNQTFTLPTASTLTTPVMQLTPGDAAPLPHGDNYIDIQDYAYVLGCVGLKTTDANSSTCPDPKHADMNEDGVIDANDLQKVKAHFGESGDSPFPPQFTCVTDPACVTGKNSMQVCALKCNVTTPNQ